MAKMRMLLGAILAGILLAGCGGTDTGNTEPEGGAQEMQEENADAIRNGEVDEIAEQIKNSHDFCAIIREIGDGKVVLDKVEFITLADAERMAELELTEANFPNGYYIYDADDNTEEYTLADGAQFNFIDWNRDFIEEDAEEINVSTNDRAVFEKYMEPYLENRLNILFFFTLDGEQVSSITEEALTSI